MAKVEINRLLKVFPDRKSEGVVAVNHIDLVVRDREFMVIVGPSGCGKSTTLRMIAGLEEITGGEISIDGRVINNIAPKDRDIAMVFQNYALYPHMNVFENMAFGLKLRKFSKAEIQTRVNEAAQVLGIENLLHRKPRALSGGQRQRVAVGRAIVRKPKVFLFDEPLSNLDAKMRVSTRAEISKLHARLAATMIYVTHDQVEAMTMGDRICVMNDANIMQVDEPLKLYNQPENMFVAGFIGNPPMNFLQGTLVQEGPSVFFVADSEEPNPLRLKLGSELARRGTSHIDKQVVFGIRPEDIHDLLTVASFDREHTAEVLVDVSEPMGNETFLYLSSGSRTFVGRVRSNERFETNQPIKVWFDMENAHLFDPDSENALK